MKQHSFWIMGIILYIICSLATAFLIISSIAHFNLSHGEKFLCAFVTFAMGFMASSLLCKAKVHKAKGIMRASLIWLFAVYVLVVIDFTLLSGSFGRNISNIFNLSTNEVQKYIDNNTNIVPFATVKLYVNAYKTDNIMPYIVAENLLGNLLVFMPFAFFAPALIKKISSAWRFLVLICAVVLVIELLQIVFLTGSADIDDFILNVAGAMAAYGVVQKTIAQKFTKGCESGADKGKC